MSAASVDWETCCEDGCVGVRSNENRRCLAHLAPDELESALSAIRGDGKVDARGVEISSELLRRILNALPQAPDGHPRFQQADFRGAAFNADARFGEATFAGNAWFREATFEENAWFRKATFKADAVFGKAIFMKRAGFSEATFKDAVFGGATFNANAWFGEATFKADAGFREATFKADAWFGEAIFKADASFRGATFAGNASFREATFERARQFGPTLVLGTLSLEEASFLQTVDLGVSANRLSLVRATFPAGGHIQARWAEIVMEDADFAQPSILAGVSRFSADFKERKLVRALKREGARSNRSGVPRILSLRRANVGNLVLADVGLVPCRFAKARNLDGLRLQGTEFARPPTGMWARRKVLAEEHQWRATQGWSRRRRGWYLEEVRPPAWFAGESPEVVKELDPHSVAAIYRDLRKGREDKRDEPGAADFYYGEMEMRRFDNTKPRAERFILSLYWLTSGYGLRASRALLSLLVTVFVFGVLLYIWGFPFHRSFLDAVTFSAESTTSLFRAPERPLTLAGEWLQIGLRLLGPLFFGLVLFSLRGRIKR